jgi:uncharacterized damage-inducible protein DinB
MTIAETFLPEFDREMAITRKLLERIPDDKRTWKPHSKSYSLGDLGSHLANILNWVSTTLDKDSYDMAGDEGGDQHEAGFASSDAMLAAFDARVKEARTLIASKSDAHMMLPWSLKSGDQVLMSMPRAATLRAFILSHSIHHRGQLSVYLRMLDIPVPAIYGPSADESN